MPDTKLVTWEGLLCHYGRFPCKNSGNLRLMVISSDFLLSFFPILLSCLPKANIYQIAASSKNGTNQKHPFTNIPKQVHQNILTSCNTSDAFETHRNATKTNWLHAPFPTPQKKNSCSSQTNTRHVMEYPPASRDLVWLFCSFFLICKKIMGFMGLHPPKWFNI